MVTMTLPAEIVIFFIFIFYIKNYLTSSTKSMQVAIFVLCMCTVKLYKAMDIGNTNSEIISSEK